MRIIFFPSQTPKLPTMRDFFHGWRRKLGVFALVMACVMMGMWIRSRVVTDTVQLPSSRFLPRLVSSWDRFIVLTFPSQPADDRRWMPIWMTKESRGIGELYEHAFTEWRWRFGGFAAGKTTMHVWIIVIPYWAITTPLTVLAAGMILWPRKQGPSTGHV